ncbi:Cellulose biosynthesis protein BcsQ [compost metagenome]
MRGGVGNSSLLAAIGHALHSLGQRVLMVDMCPENLLGLHFNLAVTERSGWARAMLDGQGWQSQAWNVASGLCLLPYGRLDGIEQEQVEQHLRNEPDLWVRRERSLAGHFDWVLFDLPQRLPGHAAIGVDALQIQVLEADAACHVLLQRQDAKHYLLINRFDPASQLQNDLLLVWRNRYGALLLPVAVHYDEAMREALANKEPVGRYASSSLVAQDIMSLVTWCLAHSRGEL